MTSAARADSLLGGRSDLKIMLIDDDEGMHTLVKRIVSGAKQAMNFAKPTAVKRVWLCSAKRSLICCYWTL